jgi:hypothetical protein
MMAIQIDPDTMFGRKALAKALTDAGLKTAASTLATRATRGGGPKFRRYGRYPIYRWGDALEWAQSRLSRPVTSTSELDVHDEQPPLAAPSLGHNGGPPLDGAGEARPDDRPAA